MSNIMSKFENCLELFVFQVAQRLIRSYIYLVSRTKVDGSTGDKGTSTNYQRHAGVIWLLGLIKHLYFMGVWLGEDQITNTMKTYV